MVGTRSSGRATDTSVGELLQQERLRRRLSLDAVAHDLRIPPRQLKALEEGDLSVFSAEVYARGAYMHYASYLGIADTRTYQALLRLLSGVRERVALTVPLPASWWERVLTPSRVFLLGLGMVTMVIAAYIGWHVQAFVRQPGLELLEPEQGVIAASEVKVRGTAEEGSVVTVNGEPILLNEQGVFELVLPLKPGVNVVQVEARGASGSAHVIRRELLLPDKV
jgi:hypothetical protein